MFKNSAKLLFLMTLMMGTLISISSNSWLGAWMGLEINLLSFIPLMIDNENLMSNEATLKYFLTQALASAMLLFSIIIFMLTYNLSMQELYFNSYIMLMINSTLLLKSGAAPFHFWFPGVMEGLSWMNNLILMTWQKLAPLILISYCMMPSFMIIIVILSTLIGSLGGLNQISLYKLMAFSSINHLGWMIAALLSSLTLWLTYFIIYSFLSFTLIYLFNSFQLFNFNQAFSMFNNQPINKFCFFMSLLSLGGLPPFLGFFPKWIVIQTILPHFFLLFLMVSMTLITLYFYIRLYYSSMILNYWETSWNFMSSYNSTHKKLSILLNFFSLSGLTLINTIYFLN